MQDDGLALSPIVRQPSELELVAVRPRASKSKSIKASSCPAINWPGNPLLSLIHNLITDSPPTLLATACANGAAALHINLYTSTNCNGPYFTCVNWTRSTCCDPNFPLRRFVSVDFVNLDRSRDWELRVYNGRRLCASWGNFNRKRDVQGGDDEAPAGCGRPQELGLPDGTRFNLTVSLAFDSPDDISEQFQEPKIAA
ncbi:hypothetical protein CGRA01v4_09918 [Colletotrichum graminicola]|nr:hypothetical protein CGRA01v4_09918 [Colletotrichum graminicola]